MKQIRRLLFFIKPFWRRSLASIFLLVGVVLMDLSLPRLIQRIIDQGINQRNQAVVIQTTVIMLVIALIQLLFAIANNILSIQVGEGVARDVREALFLKIQSFSFGNLDHLNTGQLMVRLSSDTSTFQRMVQISLRNGSKAPLLVIGSLILMFNTDPQLALKVLPVLLFSGLLIAFFVGRMGPLFLTVQQKFDRLNMVLQENIAGVRLVKAFVRAEHEEERFTEVNEDYMERNVQVMKFMATLNPALNVCVNIGMVIVIWAGGIQTIADGVSIGQIVAFINYLHTCLGTIGTMALVANVVAAAAASARRIGKVLDTVPEVQDPEDPRPLPDGKQKRITFENVVFCFDGDRESEVLDGINLTAEPGKTIAILGATGAGKSSLVNLVPRFYDVESGKITLNGTDIRQLRQNDLLSLVGIVPQETILFSGTVRDNIRFGKPDAEEADVVAAAKIAQAHDFITRLPHGYDTRIEERGVNLSGGQKQRIAIARALLLKSDILILDDSTSSVDVETENRIQTALKEQMDAITCFVVAQRISTVLNADRIVVIDRGKIAAQGTHSELIQSNPIYREIYDSQLGNGVGVEEKG